MKYGSQRIAGLDIHVNIIPATACGVVTWLGKGLLVVVLAQAKVLEFVKVDHTKLFIMTAKNNCSCTKDE